MQCLTCSKCTLGTLTRQPKYPTPPQLQTLPNEKYRTVRILATHHTFTDFRAQGQDKGKARRARGAVEPLKGTALKKYKKDKGVQKLTKGQCHAPLCAEFNVPHSSSQLIKKKAAGLRGGLKRKAEAVPATAPGFRLD